MDNLLSGLFGALVGSVVGFLGSWWIQHQAVRDDERGAARALFFEMVANAATLRRVAWGHAGEAPTRQLATKTWEATQSKVGALLKPNELLVVAQAYEDLPSWQVFIDEKAKPAPLPVKERDLLMEVADSIAKAAEMLRDRAWDKRQLDNFPRFRGGATVASDSDTD